MDHDNTQEEREKSKSNQVRDQMKLILVKRRSWDLRVLMNQAA